MDLILLVVMIALLGLVVWLVTTRIPMPPGWAVTIQVLALAFVVLYVITRYLAVPNVLTP